MQKPMENLGELETKWKGAAETAATVDALEAIRVEALGKKGEITGLMKTLGTLAPEERKSFGQQLNLVKDAITAAIETRKASLGDAAIEARLATEKQDLTLPARPGSVGRIHPISQTIDEIIAIFGEMGFGVREGPDIEDDFHNFEALNIPKDHPARQMQDTFYLPQKPDGSQMVLRTHTSPVQVRTMLSEKPPLRIICPGRTYRVDSDMTHSPMFHQVEGLVIDEGTHMGHLKGCLQDFCRAFFGIDDLKLRFRPSYFPLHRTLRRSRYRLRPFRRRAEARGRQRLAGDPRLRHGASEGTEELRARSREIPGLCLRHGNRAHRHAEIRDSGFAHLL